MDQILYKKRKTLLALIQNSVGTKMFRNIFVTINGKESDATRNGLLSCAFFVSSVLKIAGYCKQPHAAVDSTVKDLKESGWIEIDKPTAGDVLVWEASDETAGHTHIGFYVGNNKAISNNSKKGYPTQSDWTFNEKRKVTLILTNPEFKEEL